MNFQCFKCNTFFPTMDVIIKHLKKDHFILDNDIPIKCCVKSDISCGKKYLSFRSLRQHMKSCQLKISDANSCDLLQISGTENVIPPIQQSETEHESNQFTIKSKEQVSNEIEYVYAQLPNSNYREQVKSDIEIPFNYLNRSVWKCSAEQFEKSLNFFSISILTSAMKQSDMNQMFNQTVNLLQSLRKLIIDCMSDENVFRPQESLDFAFNFACDKIKSHDSIYKRSKSIQSSPNFVEPKEKAVGTRWELKKTKNRFGRVVRIPRLIQCTLQYVPILDTLRRLFAQSEFRNLYLEHNKNINELISEDMRHPDYVYRCFNSGSVFKSNLLFKHDPNSIQIQISQDDFEICNELQSKSNRHKICAVYFKIQNLPHKYLSKLNNIYLVCICNADDLKTKHTDSNNIWQIVMNELQVLESDGIYVEGYGNLKGTLATTAFDNLGANVCLGFVPSFNSLWYCRHGECHRNDCREFTSPDDFVPRSKESYNRSIELISESSNVDYNQTKGVRSYCLLSDLKYFHVIDNPTADIMHDIAEGAIPCLIKEIFEYCLKNRICSLETLSDRVKYFDYGVLNNCNTPSAINTQKRALGQNASQSLCLFRHLPCILRDYQNDERMTTIWECTSSLLRICETIYSTQVRESEIRELEHNISKYLTTYMQFSAKKLIPKQHFMIHYPKLIRTMGPLVHFNMIRSEAKHSSFKTWRKATRNFIAINKSLVFKHQRMLCMEGYTYNDNFNVGVLKIVPTSDDSVEILHSEFGFEKQFFTTSYLNLNSFKFREGLAVIHERAVYQIQKIFYVGNKFYFKCFCLIVHGFDAFLNSIELKVDHLKGSSLIAFNELQVKKVYEIKTIAQSHYIICDTLDLRNNLK